MARTVAVVLLAAAAAAGCAASEPPCSQATSSAIDRAELAEILERCKGHRVADCPAMPDIRAKYTKERLQCLH